MYRTKVFRYFCSVYGNSIGAIFTPVIHHLKSFPLTRVAELTAALQNLNPAVMFIRSGWLLNP